MHIQKNLKITHISTFFDGGASIAANRLHHQLLNLNIDSNMLILSDKTNAIPKSIQNLNFYHQIYSLNIFQKIKVSLQWKYYDLLKQKKLNNSGLFSFSFPSYPIKQLSILNQSDIIHLHWINFFFSLKECVYFKKNNKPIFITLHDMNLFTGGCHYSLFCEKFKEQCIDCPYTDSSLLKKIIEKNFNTKLQYLNIINPIIIAPSKWILQQAKSSKILKNKTIIHIPNGINLQIFKKTSTNEIEEFKKKNNIPNDKTVLLFVSTSIQNPYKDGHLLMQILSLIKNHKNKLIAIVIGSSKNYIDENIYFYTPTLSENDIIKFYSISDILIITSLSDNLPNVLLEAASVGLALIGHNTGGIPEIIMNNINGFVINTRNPLSLIHI